MNRKIFFEEYKKNLDPNQKLDQKEVDAINLFLNFYERDKLTFNIPQWSYAFATVFHETAATFLPLREAPKLSEEWRKRNFRYFPFYGRGYVQLTWERNYALYSKKLGIDLVGNPDLAMKPEYAWFILIDGFKNGVFTGKKISDYINDKKKDYRNARRCINGTDRMDLIAKYALEFEKILLLSE